MELILIVKYSLLAISVILALFALSIHVKAYSAHKKTGAERISRYAYHQKTKKAFAFYAAFAVTAIIALFL